MLLTLLSQLGVQPLPQITRLLRAVSNCANLLPHKNLAINKESILGAALADISESTILRFAIRTDPLGLVIELFELFDGACLRSRTLFPADLDFGHVSIGKGASEFLAVRGGGGVVEGEDVDGFTDVDAHHIGGGASEGGNQLGLLTLGLRFGGSCCC